ncbi:hypothetical protein CRE_19660 [Caenorhabditis remanei]|uniref:Uncharacterized protein n=1 Tax=Caenorhabditis remanei TaxID=31234 RepID=E3MD62_CAERE|nr:hypothetical protein CRE_19660 [Caenorhabditis remanei]
MTLLIPIFLALIAIYILSFYQKFLNYQRLKHYASKIPGPPLEYIMGNTYLFRNKTSDEFILMFKEEARKARERGETVIRFLLPGKMIVWPLNGKAVSQIVESTTEIYKGSDYSMFEPWIGGLLLLTGDIWKSHRKMITPTFHFAKLEGYFNVFNSESKVPKGGLPHITTEFQILTSCLSKFADSNETVDIFPYINRCLLDIICETAMGTKVNAQFNHDHPYLKAVKGYAAMMVYRFAKFLVQYSSQPIMWNPILFWALGYKKQQDDYLRILKKFTSDTALIRTNYKPPKSKLIRTRGDVNKLNYLELAMKESKRLFPPVPVFQRHLQKDMVIDGHTIPAGANITIAPVVLHDNHLVYSNPELFDPDRFLPEETAKRHSYDFIPFSAGIKNCIGQKFAVLNEKVLISHLIRSFKIEPMLKFRETRPCFEVVSKPSRGIPVKLTKRC